MPLVLSGDGAVGPLSATEVSYLDGVTSAVQTQIDGKLATPGTWSSYTPTWTNVTVGNAVVTARYTQMGKTVTGFAKITLGSTSAVTGSIRFSLPVTLATGSYPVANGYFGDAGTGWFSFIPIEVSSALELVAINTAGTYGGGAYTSSTIPFTWTTNDVVICTFTYEAA